MMFDNFYGMWNYWIFGMFFMLLAAIYVANDASRFGENGMFWALIVFFMPMMGLLVYLVVRSTWTRSRQEHILDSNMNYQSNTGPPRRETVNVYHSNTSMNDLINKSKSKIGTDEFNDTQFCTSCGTENSSNAAFCNSCGAEIKSSRLQNL